uniref:Uncharacterized protein n=1 Tax=Triticum urartu TaxID=4572 RepID=A0A8R7QP97_TRIUA
MVYVGASSESHSANTYFSHGPSPLCSRGHSTCASRGTPGCMEATTASMLASRSLAYPFRANMNSIMCLCLPVCQKLLGSSPFQSHMNFL